jgi:hypothetical protein
MAHLLSSDPRKSLIVMKLKQESKASKITLVTDDGDGRFSANCLIPEIQLHKQGFVVKTGRWVSQGRFWVQFELNRDGSLGQHINGGKVNEQTNVEG